MADTVNQDVVAPTVSAPAEFLDRLRRSSEFVLIPLFALIAAGLVFSIFLFALGYSPATFFSLLWKGGFGTAFSWQNTLVRAAPLILTGLCVAIPARLGLVIIGGEGALVLGGFTAAVSAIPFVHAGAPAYVVLPVMLVCAILTGAFWIGFVGALRHYRGINETIASLLMSYIAIAIMNFFVEGALRDPADPNKPSTKALESAEMIGKLPGIDVHSVEPSAFDDTARSLAAGRRLGNPPDARSFCDALLSPMPGELTFAVNSRLLARGLAVSDAEVAHAMRLAFRHLRLVVEPGGAVALAAALAGKLPVRGRTVGVVVSGGNVDAELFAKVLTAA